MTAAERNPLPFLCFCVTDFTIMRDKSSSAKGDSEAFSGL